MMKSNWIRRSLRVKLVFFLVLAIAIPMLSSIYITNNRTREIVTEDTVRQASHLIFQGKTNLSHFFDTINQASLLPYYGTQTGDVDTLYRILEHGRDDYVSENEIYRAMLSVSQSVKEIHQVYLFAEASQKGYLTISGKLNKEETDNPYRSAQLKDDLSVYIEGIHESHNYSISRPYHAPKQVITIHRRLE